MEGFKNGPHASTQTDQATDHKRTDRPLENDLTEDSKTTLMQASETNLMEGRRQRHRERSRHKKRGQDVRLLRRSNARVSASQISALPRSLPFIPFG